MNFPHRAHGSLARAFTRASLWLRPEGAARARIRESMRLLRARGGGPEFEPHVTLLDAIVGDPVEASRKLGELAARIRPFPVRLGRIAWGDTRFRCLFAIVEPGAELVAARRCAAEIFGAARAGPYEPHLSLLYGDLDVSLKRELAAASGGRLDVSFEAAAVDLVNATAEVPVAEWRTLAALRFVEG